MALASSAMAWTVWGEGGREGEMGERVGHDERLDLMLLRRAGTSSRDREEARKGEKQALVSLLPSHGLELCGARWLVGWEGNGMCRRNHQESEDIVLAGDR